MTFWLPIRSIGVKLCCGRMDGRFIDRVFTPEVALGKVEAVTEADIEWKRLSDILPDAKLFSGKIEPSDVIQSQLGDCWLLAAMASMCEYKGLVQDLFITKQFSPIGKYQVKLFFKPWNKWVTVTVDDYVPCRKGTNDPVFAKPHGPEMWACILEKAFAKVVGSYGNLEGGHPLWALEAMTGDFVSTFKRLDESGRWKKLKMVHAPTVQNPTHVQFMDKNEFVDDDEMFNVVRKFDSINSIMCAATTGSSDKHSQGGVVNNHAYTLIGAWRIRPTLADHMKEKLGAHGRKGTLKLVKLRNPWGKFEHTGDWSDTSPLWTEHPDVASSVGFQGPKDDGIFFMAWEDFIVKFDCIDVCKRSVGMRDLTLDLKEDSEGCGPVVGCMGGLCKYYCLCKGPITMLSTTASDEDTVETALCESCTQCTPYKIVYR